MMLSQKCQYAIRSMLELAKHSDGAPVCIGAIANKQAIPSRFLENILSELKTIGLVESRRGAKGGYLLAKSPEDITIGDIIRLIDGPLEPVRCLGDGNYPSCPLRSRCALINLWNEAKKAVENVYDGATLKDIIQQQELSCQNIDYCI